MHVNPCANTVVNRQWSSRAKKNDLLKEKKLKHEKPTGLFNGLDYNKNQRGNNKLGM